MFYMSALNIDSTSTTGSDYVANLLGSGITVDGGSISYIGAPDQSGFFSGGLSSGLGFDTGVIMTTGSAYNAPGPNDVPNISTYTGTGTDLDLNLIIWNPSGQPPITYDKTVLEFDFSSDGGDLFFNFAFASEEYNEYIGTVFNDLFGFYVDGVNVALLPDLSPVAIANVNCGNPYSGSGPNCGLFNNNESGDYDLQYDGFTDAFTASATGLAAGTHSMKFVLADAADTTLDSAIFIEAGTFSSTQTSIVPIPAAAWLFASGLAWIGAVRRRGAG